MSLSIDLYAFDLTYVFVRRRSSRYLSLRWIQIFVTSPVYVGHSRGRQNRYFVSINLRVYGGILNNQYFRLHKYGTADKIPRHKYGIYSKQWPLEREKIISETRKKFQLNFMKSQVERISQQKKISASVDSMAKAKQARSIGRATPTEPNFYKSISRLLSSVQGTNVVERENPTYNGALTRISKPNLMRGNFEQSRLEPKNSMRSSKISQHSRQTYSTSKSIVQKENAEDTYSQLKLKVSQGDRLNKIKAAWQERKFK